MNKELCKKLEVPTLIQYDSGKPRHTHEVTKIEGKYFVENITKAHLHHLFDTIDQLHGELLIDKGARHSADAFDDQTGENIFKGFPIKGKDF